MGFLLFLTGLWGFITVATLIKYSGQNISATSCRGVGYFLISVASVCVALFSLVKNEPVYSNIFQNLIIGFSSAVAGVYIGRGYLPSVSST